MNKYITALLVALTVVIHSFAQTNNNTSLNNQSTDAAMISNDTPTIVEFNTTEGVFKILLYNDTPKHRDNFIKLVSEGYYDGLLFHRVIKDFMVQTGDPNSKNAKKGERLGSGDPGYTVEAEILYPQHFHKYGAIAAARTPDQFNPQRRSSGSQFYIVTGTKYNPKDLELYNQHSLNNRRQKYFNDLTLERRQEIQQLQSAGDTAKLETLKAELIKLTEEAIPYTTVPAEIAESYSTIGGTPHLDGQYTVFGEVVEGMDVVEKIQNSTTDSSDRPLEDIKIISATLRTNPTTIDNQNK